MTNPDSTAPHVQPHTVHVMPAQSRFAGLGAIAIMIGVIIVFGIAFLFILEMRQLPPASQQAAGEQGDVAFLRDRVASDEARLAVLERGGPGDLAILKSTLQQTQSDLAALSIRTGRLEIAPAPQVTARLDDLDKRLAASRTDYDFRIAALERNVLSSDLPQRMVAMTSVQAALDARIAKLERVDPSVTMRRAGAELALANLVRASGGSGAFAVELQTLRTLMPDAAEAAELAAISLKGAPARADLETRFPDVAAQALAAENNAHAKSWLGRFWSNIGNLIIVRRVGDPKGADSESILARGGAQLNHGDLAGAIAELKALKGSARASVQPWLQDAQARLAIERDTSALANRMAKLLATP